MLSLKPNLLSIIQNILAEQVPHHTVWVYGSRIKGTAHEGSDIDLVILPSEKNLTPHELFALRDAFSESNLPILVDILDWSTLPTTFQQEIQQQHEVIYQPKE